MNEFANVHPLLWVLIAILLLIQASWIFYDASKRGEKKWLWGFFGLLNVPSNLIIYLIITRMVMKTKQCSSCGNVMRKNAKFCPTCGQKIDE